MTALDDVNIRTPDAAGLAARYEELLGLAPGPRPGFPFQGVWLYIGDRAVVHLVETDKPLSRDSAAPEHFAFRAAGVTGFMDKLRSRGIAFEPRKVPGTDITEVNLEDPAGTRLHVDFAGED